jgi:hypothetical protein
MKVGRNNNSNNTTATASTVTITTSFLTHAKRVTLVFLIMASFTLAIANISFANAQHIEFIVQFGTSDDDTAQGVSTDPSSGDVYVVGNTHSTLPDQTSEGDVDAFIRKYNSDGDEIWTRQFGTSGADSAFAVSVDSSSGDVYVVGDTFGTLPDQTSPAEGSGDAFIRKYNSDGDEIWTRQFGTEDSDVAFAVSVDSSSGDVYVAGETFGTVPDQTSPAEGSGDAFIRKYNSDGDEIWTRQFGTSENDIAYGVSADPSSGDVYVVGETLGTMPDQSREEGRDAFIRKYNSDGDEIWTRQFGVSTRDTAQGVSTDPSSGDVYVAGETFGTMPDQTSEGGVDAFIRKYNSDGDEIWTRQFGTSSRDTAQGVSTDSSSGDVYVGGDTGGVFDGEIDQEPDEEVERVFEIFVSKYNSDGDEIWTRQFGASEDSFARGVSTDPSSGDVYIVGVTDGVFPDQTRSGPPDAFLAKLVDEDVDDDDDDDDKRKRVDEDNDKRKHHDDDDEKRRKH